MNFKDCEILTIELKTVMFKSLYAWMAAYNSPSLVLLNFGLVFFFFFLPNWGSFLYTPYVFGLRPSTLSNETNLLKKKIYSTICVKV